MSSTPTRVAGETATEETSQLIASDKVEGTAVYTRSGEQLGSVYNFMVLTYDTSLGGHVVNRTKEQLERAPSYSASELQSWDDAVYRGRIEDYYN